MNSYEDVLQRIRGELPERYPFASQHPQIAGPLAEQLAYEEWMHGRIYDHISLDARRTEYGPRYYYHFHRAPSRQTGRVDTIVLSPGELTEVLITAAAQLGIDIVNGEVRGQAKEEGSHG